MGSLTATASFAFQKLHAVQLIGGSILMNAGNQCAPPSDVR